MVGSASDIELGNRSDPQADIGPSARKHEKTASFLTVLAALAFLYPISIAVLFAAGIMTDDGLLAYRALRAVMVEEQFGWLTEHWAALPAASIAAALTLSRAKRALYLLTAAFLVVAVLNSIWLAWISEVNVHDNEFTSRFVIHDITLQSVYIGLERLRELVLQTRDLAVIGISGAAGVMGVQLAQGRSKNGQGRA